MAIIRGVAITLVVLALFGLLFGCTQNNTTTTESGRYVVGVTDAATNMSSVSKIEFTIDNVQVHSSSGAWTTLSTESKTFDLLELDATSTTQLLVDVNIPKGTYDQIELNVKSVMVTDDSGTHEAKLPSNRFKVIANTVIDANKTSTAHFDILADESLHVTGNGSYIFAPVVNVETRSNAQVSVNSNNNMSIAGGLVNTKAKFGMDEKGNVGINVHIPIDTNLTIGAGGTITIVPGLGIGTSSESNSNAGSETNGSIGVGGVGVGASANVTINLSIQGYEFSQKSITIKKGDTVVWTNLDAVPHTVTSDSGTELDSGTMVTSVTYSHTFNTKGTYTYHCGYHPSMTGTVIVE